MEKGKKMGGGQRSEGDGRERERGAESKGECEKEKKGRQGRKPQNLRGAALGGSRVTSVSVKAGTCQEHTECSTQCIPWPLI